MLKIENFTDEQRQTQDKDNHFAPALPDGFYTEGLTEAELATMADIDLDTPLLTEWEEPEYTRPRVTIRGEALTYEGGIILIEGQQKSRKSLLMSAMMSACICAGDDQREPAEGIANPFYFAPDDYDVTYIDTEQGKKQIYKQLQKIANLSSKTGAEVLRKMKVYDFLRYTETAERYTALERILRAPARKGAKKVVFLDVISDVFTNTNDIEETQRKVNKIVSICQQNDIILTCVLHTNPTKGDSIEKAKGHLGSLLYGKAVAILSVRRDTDLGVSIVDSPRGCRNGEFLSFSLVQSGKRNEGSIVFYDTDELKFGRKEERKEASERRETEKREEITGEILRILNGSPEPMNQGEIITAVQRRAKGGANLIRKLIGELTQDGELIRAKGAHNEQTYTTPEREQANREQERG